MVAPVMLLLGKGGAAWSSALLTARHGMGLVGPWQRLRVARVTAVLACLGLSYFLLPSGAPDRLTRVRRLGVIDASAMLRATASPPTFTKLLDPCEAFADVEGIILTLVKREDLARHTQRFDYVDDRRYSLVAFYGEGEHLPVLGERVDGRRSYAIRLPVENLYPPRTLEMAAMALASRCMTDPNTFVLRLDLDAFVAPRYLDSLSEVFANSSNAMSVLGKAGFGRQHNVGKLGFPEGVPYCLGGPSVAYGRRVLEEMRGRWEGCIASPASPHSDTEAQRCIYEHTGQYCTDVTKRFKIFNMYRQDRALRLVNRGMDSKSPDSVMAAADVVHPLKADEEFDALKTAALRRLAPPVVSLQVLQGSHLPKMTTPCVLNTFAQRQLSSCTGEWNGDDCSFSPPRCRYHKGAPALERPPEVFMLALSDEEQVKRQARTRARLERAGFMGVTEVYATAEQVGEEMRRTAEWVGDNFRAFAEKGEEDALLRGMRARLPGVTSSHADYVPTAGEVGYRAAGRAALAEGLKSGAEFFIVADNDMVPIRGMWRELQANLERGCGRALAEHGGVLMLGASEWRDTRWPEIGATAHDKCYDVHDRTMGSFAVLYNRDGAAMVLQVLDERPNMPFDHAFYQAALKGAFASVALPNLAVMDHRNKTSRVDPDRPIKGNEWETRVQKSRWDVSLYDWEE